MYSQSLLGFFFPEFCLLCYLLFMSRWHKNLELVRSSPSTMSCLQLVLLKELSRGEQEFGNPIIPYIIPVSISFSIFFSI